MDEMVNLSLFSLRLDKRESPVTDISAPPRRLVNIFDMSEGRFRNGVDNFSAKPDVVSKKCSEFY